MSPLDAFSKNPIKIIFHILVIVGALNWLSIGFSGYNFVDDLAGRYANYVYMSVGVAGLYALYCKMVWFMK